MRNNPYWATRSTTPIDDCPAANESTNNDGIQNVAGPAPASEGEISDTESDYTSPVTSPLQQHFSHNSDDSLFEDSE